MHPPMFPPCSHSANELSSHTVSPATLINFFSLVFFFSFPPVVVPACEYVDSHSLCSSAVITGIACVAAAAPATGIPGNATGMGTGTIDTPTGAITGAPGSAWLGTIWGTMGGIPGGRFIAGGSGGRGNWLGGTCTGCCIGTCMCEGTRLIVPWTSGGPWLEGAWLEGRIKGGGCTASCLGMNWLLGRSCVGVGLGAFCIALEAMWNVFVAITGLDIGCSAISCSNLKSKNCSTVKICIFLTAVLGIIRSTSPRSVQLSPMGSELSWGLLADQSESRKFLCPYMERLCTAPKLAAKIHVQCFAKMYSSVSRLCDDQSLQSHLLRSKNDKEKYWIFQLFQRRLFTEYRMDKCSAG